MPTEPAAAFGDVDAMAGMIPPLLAEIGEVTPMFGRRERRCYMMRGFSRGNPGNT